MNRFAVLRLARQTSRLIERITGEPVATVDPARLRIVQHVYGGAYGRPLGGASRAVDILQAAAGIGLDDTYSAKAWVAALDEVRQAPKGRTLFWLTFDARCLTN